MRVDFVSHDYEDAIKHILSYCFGLPLEFGESFVNETFVPENCIGCFDGDTLGGLLYIPPYDMFYYGKTVPMGGIGVVSTLPEYRHCHCASSLLIKSLEIMRDRGYVFSALGPFSYSFYRKYGWELAFHTKAYRISIDSLKGFGRGEGQFRPLTREDIVHIKPLYEGFISKYNGAIRRDDGNWDDRLKDLIEDKNYGYGYSRQGKGLNGYIFYSIDNDVFKIREMVYDSIETKLELLRFVYYHSAQAEELFWRAPQDDNTPLLLGEPPKSQEIHADMMIRVVDVEKVLLAYAYPMTYNGSLVIKVNDKWAPWNHGTFKVRVGEGVVQVEPGSDDTVDLELDIQTFSQVILGYIGMKEAIELGKVALYNKAIVEDMETIFKSHATYMTDSF